MRKSQSSLFIVIGLTVLILSSIFMVKSTQKNQVDLESQNYEVRSNLMMKKDINENINFCVEISVETSIEETGIREETLNDYKKLVASEIKECITPFFIDLEKRYYDVEEGDVVVDAGLNSESIVVNVIYPITIENGKEIAQFDEFHYTFDRSSKVSIPGGITDKETRVVSPDDRAELRIPEGVEIRDEEGNLVDEVGIKVEDLHFDGLENKVLIGELVYEFFPDVTFSEPVELEIEFNLEDIPEGYTTENLKLAYWDEEDSIWYALPTEIRDDRAIVNSTHLSRWSLGIGRPILINKKIFRERFSPTGGSPNKGEKVWLIGGSVGDPKGTVRLQINYDLEKLKAHKQFGDWREIKNAERINFTWFPKTDYGYYEDPNDFDSFVNCEEPGENYGVEYLMKAGYPYFVEEYYDDETNTTKERDILGWHNLQCNGGRVLPEEGKPVSDFLIFQSKGNSILGLSHREDPLMKTFVYPIEGSVNKYYLLDPDNEDPKYTFYCEFIEFPDGGTVKEITLNPEDLAGSPLLEGGLDINSSYLTFGVYGVKAFKDTNHPISRYDTHAQCELFWYYWGSGAEYTNVPVKETFKGLKIPYEIWIEPFTEDALSLLIKAKNTITGFFD